MTTDNLLMQMIADVLDIPVVRPMMAETVALGAAYAAGLAVGYWPTGRCCGGTGKRRRVASDDVGGPAGRGARPVAARDRRGAHVGSTPGLTRPACPSPSIRDPGPFDRSRPPTASPDQPRVAGCPRSTGVVGRVGAPASKRAAASAASALPTLSRTSNSAAGAGRAYRKPCTIGQPSRGASRPAPAFHAFGGDREPEVAARARGTPAGTVPPRIAVDVRHERRCRSSARPGGSAAGAATRSSRCRSRPAQSEVPGRRSLAQTVRAVGRSPSRASSVISRTSWSGRTAWWPSTAATRLGKSGSTINCGGMLTPTFRSRSPKSLVQSASWPQAWSSMGSVSSVSRPAAPGQLDELRPADLAGRRHPAGQRLHGCHPPVGQVDDRLVDAVIRPCAGPPAAVP